MPARSEKQANLFRAALGDPKPGTQAAKIKATVSRNKIKDFTKTESKCSCCGGDGWYVEPDAKGEPQQVQCSACQGQGGCDDPEPNLRPSGEPKNEPFNEVGHIKLTEVLAQMEGEEEKLGSSVYDREDKDWYRSNQPTQLHHLRNKPQISGMKGITFFDVKPGQEADAVRYGLSRFKSGRWGLVHRQDKNEHNDILPTIKTKFGQGNYWEPKKQ